MIWTADFHEEQAKRREQGIPPDIIAGDWRRAFKANLRDPFRRSNRNT